MATPIAPPMSASRTASARNCMRMWPLVAPSARRSPISAAAEFQRLADVPPEIEWFANIRNRERRRAYENAIRDFMQFTGIARPEEFRAVTRAHVIAWRDDLARRGLGGATIRHRHAALSSLFEFSARKTPLPITQSRASSGRRPRAAKEKPRRSAIIRRASCSRHPATRPLRRKRGQPSCRLCSIMRCAARSLQAPGPGFPAHPARRSAPGRLWQRREDPLSAITSQDQCADP